MTEATQAPRTPRNPWKLAVAWTIGCLTDPHTKWSSASRIVGLVVAFALCAYVLVCAVTKQDPNAWVCSTLSGLVCAALALRAKSTQTSAMPSAQRAADRAPLPPLPPHEV